MGNYRICLNCVGDAQRQQELFEEAHERILSMQSALRDEFAMRVLPAVITRSWPDEDSRAGIFLGTEPPSLHFAKLAYEWADLMLEARKLPESG